MGRTIKEPVQYESLVSKLVEDASKGRAATVEELDFKNIVKLAKHSKGREDLVKDIKEIFPDIELSIEIVTSLISAPNDMGDTKLTYRIEGLSLPTNVQSGVTDFISSYMDAAYNTTDKINDIVEESLFTKGAYVELNIPPKNINDLLRKVKKDTAVGVESLVMETNHMVRGEVTNDDIFTYSSNPLALMADELEEKRVELVIEKDMEGITTGMEDLIVGDAGYGMMDDSGISNDKPIVKKMDHNNIIPIMNKNDVSKHYGYFIILNTEIKGSDKGSNDDGSDVLKKVNSTLKGHTNKVPELGSMDDMREAIIKTNLRKYLDSTIYKNIKNIDFSIDDDMVLTIADNIIKKSKLNVIFVPANLVSYYAINYRENGMGESLLERLTVLMSMRAILMFTKLLSYIKSSVTTTDVKVDLDPDDPNYRKSMEAIMAEVIRNRQVSMPIGMLKADDLTDWVHKLGFSFNFKHPGLPDVNIDIEEKSTDITPIDDSLKDDLDKMIITALYLTPEMIDNGYSPDFATSIIANNILLKKRIMKLQTAYDKLITTDIKKKLKLDGRFKKKVREYIAPNIKKLRSHLVKNSNDIDPDTIKKANDEDLINFIIEKVIASITVALPKPETTSDTNVTDMMSNYNDLLNGVVDKLFGSDLIPSDYIGTLGDNLDDIKNLVKHTLLRRYVNENNVLPDFSKMFTMDEDGKPLFNMLDDFNGFVQAVEAVTIPFLKDNKKLVEKLDKKKDKIDNGPSEEEEDTSTEEDSNTDDTSTGDTSTDDTEEDTGTDDTGSDEATSDEKDTTTDDTEGDTGTDDATDDGSTEEEPTTDV